jgi:CRP-like cAMP-binding protein
LGLLPRAELGSVLEVSELTTIRSKRVLIRCGEPIEFVYFPEDCVISLIVELEDARSVEAMTVGKDGFVGLAVLNGVPSARLTAIGQITGVARRISSEGFRHLVDDCETLRRTLLRYSHFAFETVSQSAACNRLHVIEQRCARWILMTADRVGRSDFDLTQEFLAEMLGVRRPGVSVALGMLETAGMIGQSRAHITVLDRARLEKSACECYGVITARHAELLSQGALSPEPVWQL